VVVEPSILGRKISVHLLALISVALDEKAGEKEGRKMGRRETKDAPQPVASPCRCAAPRPFPSPRPSAPSLALVVPACSSLYPLFLM
jgi:hypothetical protein